MRARRARAIGPAADAGRYPRDAGELLAPAVQSTLDALALGPEYAAVSVLALLYASAVDRAENQALALARLGPGLLKVLFALRAVPAARAAGRSASRPNRVAALRAEHIARTAGRRP